jgi:hypothetical protein
VQASAVCHNGNHKPRRFVRLVDVGSGLEPVVGKIAVFQGCNQTVEYGSFDRSRKKHPPSQAVLLIDARPTGRDFSEVQGIKPAVSSCRRI